MRIFAGDACKRHHGALKMPEGEAIEAGMVTRSIEKAQRKVEARNFDIRKQLLEYDDVANDQRKVIYQQRNELDRRRACLDRSPACARTWSRPGARTCRPNSVEEQWDLPGLEKTLADEWQIRVACRCACCARSRDEHHRRRGHLAKRWLKAAEDRFFQEGSPARQRDDHARSSRST
jgi:preprotein translocase subunit SecA